MTADRVELTDDARTDLHSVVSYLAERNPIAGERVRAAIEEVFVMLARTEPRIDGATIVLQSGTEARRWFVHPVVVIYERGPAVLRVLRVYHHARAPLDG